MTATVTSMSETGLTREAMLERLTRGGLAPDAAEKAVDAMEAGDIHALNLAVTKSGAVVCPVPFELLVKCFPVLAGVPLKNGKANPDDVRGMTLEYTINRHRGGRRSLTIFWPDEAPTGADGDPNGATADGE